MNRVRLVFSAAFLTLLGACGNPSSGSNKSGATPPTPTPSSADATGKKPLVTSNKAAPKSRQPVQDLDCSGIILHGQHESCDHEDLETPVPQKNPETPPPKTQATPEASKAAPAASDSSETKPAPEIKVGENTTPKTEPAPTTAPAPAPAPVPAPAPPPANPNIVEFRIKAGTGANPWNTAESMVTVKVGQTLRLINDDTVNHRLHTGGAPCPHGTNFAPGQSFDCVATRALDPAASPGRTYDHIAGEDAVFFLKAIP